MIKLQPKLTKKKLQLSTGNQGLKTKSLQHQGFQVAGRGRKLITKSPNQPTQNERKKNNNNRERKGVTFHTAPDLSNTL